ncbi:hypothetical protein [Shewanella sp. HN-41]|uniref:hypothetical protein n=1 Tax=Shewanella sp. HN-41 TaxID=327275 RepID=UPI0002126470|nr:hypothetical protein [Shewanella sp. HN-41]EGM71586.1 hypothetical protein SOHN41_00500 [Shewanella sp. HN-41]
MAIGICRVICTTLTLTLGLTACDNLASDKSAGIPTAREYQLISTLSINDGIETQKNMQGRVLLNYQLQDAKGKVDSLTTPLTNNAQFFVQPSLMQLSDHGMPIPISNIDPKNSARELTSIIKAGFNLELRNGDNNRLTPVTKIEEQDIAELFNRWANLKSLFEQSPTLPVVLEPRVGYSVSAPMDERLTWTVEQVSEDKLFAVLQGEKDSFKAYGKFELNRKTGWLESMALFKQDKQRGKTFTQRIVMAPKDRPYVMSILWHADDNYDAERNVDDLHKELYPISHVQREYKPNDKAFIQSLLADQQGIIDNIGDWGSNSPEEMQLRFVHAMSPQYVAADMRYGDITAFDESGKALDLNFWQHSTGSAINFSRNIESSADIIATGWDNTAAKLSQISYINAKLTLIPEANNVIDKSWDELLAKPYTFGYASLTIQPLDADAKLFKVVIKQSKTHNINLGIQQLTGKMAEARPEGDYPEWLTVSDKELLEQLIGVDENTHLMTRSLVLKLDEIPKTVLLVESQPQAELTQTKNIRFVPYTEYNQNLANPQSEFGNASMDNFIYGDLTSPKAEIGTVKDIKPATENGHNLYIPMSAALATACKPEIEQGFNEGKQTVTWQFVPKGPEGAAYHLMTPDRVRQYFYDKRIQGTIHCKGDISWQALAQSVTDRPWLIDLQSWLTDTDYGKEPSKDLPNYFRVEDAQGKPLTIRLPEASELRINEVLVDGRYLSVTGAAAKVSYMTISKDPVDIPYEFTFKPLP